MKVVVVNSKVDFIVQISDFLRTLEPDIELFTFTKTNSIISFIKKNNIDVVFMERTSQGIRIIKEILTIKPFINVIFSGENDDLASEVVHIRYSGYLTSPITLREIKEELENLRYPIGEVKTKKVNFQCFGNFEVFINNEPMKFYSEKSKELLAYLIDRNGSMCRNKDILSTLWDDDKDHYSYLKKIKFELQKALKDYKCEDILFVHYGSMGIDKSRVSCDYYNYKLNPQNEKYNGEYMNQYDWAYLNE